MIGERELIASIERLESDVLQRWIDLGWILPQNDSNSLRQCIAATPRPFDG